MNQFLIRAEGGVGIGTNEPLAALHVTPEEQSFDFSAVLNEDLLVESEESVIGIYSENQGTAGSALVLAEINTGSLEDKWSIWRETTSGSGNGDLKISFGPGVNYASNPVLAVLDTAGNLTVTGNISKGGGAFVIDHPLDPENKYLYHSFVESPDMMNVYNGNVVLNADGEAVVELPDYFQALNRDFRYQLTALGGPGPNLYVKEKIDRNRFTISGGKPDMQVSWQVTGIRKDQYADMNRIQVEVDKPSTQRGILMHPEVYVASRFQD